MMEALNLYKQLEFSDCYPVMYGHDDERYILPLVANTSLSVMK